MTATVVAAAVAPGQPSYFYQPTVLANVPNDAAALDKKIIGPVAPVTAFSTRQETINLANASG